MAVRYTIAFSAFGIVLSSGCAQIFGIDDDVTTKDELVDAAIAGIDAATTDAATPDAATPFCVDNSVPLGSSNVNTELDMDDFTPSCTSGTGNDQAFLWKAPVTDYFVFDTVGSNFDTVLSLQTTCMSESETACNNNRGQEIVSELVQKVEANDALVVVVDGFAGSQGVGKLNIERVTCPDADLEGQTFPIAQSTTSAGDDFSNSCGGDGFPDKTYHWVVPEDGLWAFNARGATFAPSISVLDGPRCQDTELACNASAGSELQTEVVRRLSANQQVSVIVDGTNGEGSFDLNISKREVTCPEDTITLDGNFSATLIDVPYTARQLTPSCGFTEIYNGLGVEFEPMDYSFALNIPPAGVACERGCSVNISAVDPFSAAMLDQNDCGGSELACIEANEAGGVFRASLGTGSSEEIMERTIVISHQSDQILNFSLSVECFVVCA